MIIRNTHTLFLSKGDRWLLRMPVYDHILYAIMWACANNPGSMNGRAHNG